MNYINSYNINEGFMKIEKKLTIVAIYLEGQQPVSKNDGFIECRYELSELNLSNVIFSFYLKNWTSEEEFEKLYDYIEENGFEFIDEKFCATDIEVRFKMDVHKIKEIFELANVVGKYNL